MIGVGSPGHSSSVSGPRPRSILSVAGRPIDRPVSSSPNTDVSPRFTRPRNPEIWFFAKMAPKTTYGSGFHSIFELRVPDLMEKDINIDEVCGRICEIFEVKF